MPRPTRKQLIDLLVEASRHGFRHTKTCDYEKSMGYNECDCGVDYDPVSRQQPLTKRIDKVLAEEKSHGAR